MSNNSSVLTTVSHKNSVLFNSLLLTLKIILILIAVAGNTLTIAAISRFKVLRYPSNVMIASLAVVDILMVSVYTPLVLLRGALPYLFGNRISCLALQFVTSNIALGSVAFQSLLSVERFYAVQFPFRYFEKVTVKHNLIWSGITLAGIVSISVPEVLGIDRWSENTVCYSTLLFPREFTRFYIITIFVLQIVGFLAFLRVLFAELMFRRRERRLQVSDLEKQTSSQTRVILLAYGVSLCLYLPHILYFMWGTFSKHAYDPVILGIVQLMDLFNAAVNCFIYGFKNTKFREMYAKLLGLKHSQVEPVTTNSNYTNA